MKKRVLVTVLVIALVLTAVSAKGSFKAGAELGWGFDILKENATASGDKYEGKFTNNGFALNLTGEYAFDKNWSVKADAGLMFAGKADTTVESITYTANKASGLWFDFALDGKYTYAVNKEFSVAGLAGIKMVYGAMMKDTRYNDDDTNVFSFGLDFGAEGGYSINDNITIVAGCEFAWLFVNSNESLNKNIKKIKDAGGSVSLNSFFIRPYAGVTYAF